MAAFPILTPWGPSAKSSMKSSVAGISFITLYQDFIFGTSFTLNVYCHVVPLISSLGTMGASVNGGLNSSLLSIQLSK